MNKPHAKGRRDRFQACLFLCFKSAIEKIKIFFLLQIIFFSVFSDHFDMLISKIIIFLKKYIYYFDAFSSKKTL
jgi:hypothetical protein